MNLPLFLLDLLAPNRCDCCMEFIDYDAALCDSCMQKLATQRINSFPLGEDAQELHGDGVFALFTYADTAKEGVLAMKTGRRGFAEYAGKLLAEVISDALPPEEISFVTWVPMQERRRRIQGYSHTELLGKSLARHLNRPARDDFLRELPCCVRQHQVTARERALLVSRFCGTGVNLQGKTILLCDDILTTGNTIRTCTHLLREMGAERVLIAVACRRLTENAETN